MNEQLQNAVATILDRAISGIDSSVDFMQAELPDVIEQLLMWYAVKGVIWIVIGLILALPLLAFIKVMLSKDIKGATSDSFWVQHWSHSDNSLGIGASFFLAVLSLLAIVGVSISMCNIMEPIQIWIAPKIWLMEYAASIVK